MPGKALLLSLLSSLAACTQQDHLNLESPWFPLDDEQVALQVSSTGWLAAEQQRISHREIGPKVLDMIAQARTTIVASVFLFDNFYSEQPPAWDVVAAFTDAIIAQKARYPDMVVALILDPSNRAYSNRVAPAVARLSAAGVDIFYSDLLATPAHTPIKLVEATHHGSRALSQATGGWLGRTLKPVLAAIRIPFVGEFDQHPANLQMALNAGLVKANHRKLVVTDRGDTIEALVSSANPHNASVSSTNFSLSVTGEIARYIYNAQRLDITRSLSLNDADYVYWHREATEQYRAGYLRNVLPELRLTTHQGKDDTERSNAQVWGRFLTEKKIKANLLAILQAVQPDDLLRIQMFYLSDIDVVNALMQAAMITRQPIKLLLDPSKDAFGKLKDGTPNRQVAALLTGSLDNKTLRSLQRYFPAVIKDGSLSELNLELRWFNTHGEQNHAKIMSITNPQQGKYILLQGSANWTGKNLSGTNMEANIRIDGSAALVDQFNAIFDQFFYNRPMLPNGNEVAPANHYPLQTAHPEERHLIYSVPYDDAQYRSHSGINKWINGEKFGFVSW